jgi:hypothetical protein
MSAAGRRYTDGADHADLRDRLDPPEPELDDPASSWPEPPDEAIYHGVLGEAAQVVAPHTEADPVAILGSLLVGFGVICGDAFGFYQGGLHRGKLQVVLVGDTSKGRKGTAWDLARRILGLVEPTFDQLVLTGIASGEGVIEHLARRIKEAEEAATEPEYRGLILESELGGLLVRMGREGSIISQTLRHAWDDVPLGNLRSKTSSLVRRHHLGLVGHITTAELHATLRTVDAANGFANRVLFLAVRRQRLQPFPERPDGHVRELVPRIQAAVEDAREHVRWLELTAAGKERWEDFYRVEAARPVHGLAAAVTARQEAQVARLALVYAAADRAPFVDVVHLEAAIALADYARRSAVHVFGWSTGNRRADALVRLLRGNGGEMGWTDARHALNIRETSDLIDAVDLLRRTGLVTVRRDPRPGGRGGTARQVIVLVEGT